MHGQVGPVFVEIDNGQIDQEAEDTGTQKVPEGCGHQKIHGPFIAEFPSFFANIPVLHQPANHQGQERNRLHFLLHGACSNPEGRPPVPVIVMGGADDTAEKGDGGCKIGYP